MKELEMSQSAFEDDPVDGVVETTVENDRHVRALLFPHDRGNLDNKYENLPDAFLWERDWWKY